MTASGDAMPTAFGAARAVRQGCGSCWREQRRSGAKTQNVVLIVSDGLRWQEIFTGAEEDCSTTRTGGSWVSEEELRKRYWRRERRSERRALLFPFLWGTVAKRGQIYRQPGPRQRRARDQRQGVLLSGIQRDEHGLSEPCHRQQRVRPQPDAHACSSG